MKEMKNLLHPNQFKILGKEKQKSKCTEENYERES